MHFGMDFSVSRKHTVVLARLPGGVKVVVNPTGRHSGWKEFLAPRDKYKQHRVLYSLPPVKFPFHPHMFQYRPYHASDLETLLQDSDPKRICCDQQSGSRSILAFCLAQFLSNYIAENFGDPFCVLFQKHAHFKTAPKNIVAATKLWLAGKMEFFHSRDDFRYYLPPSQELDVAFGKVAEIMKEV
jgi:hypothetical protein